MKKNNSTILPLTSIDGLVAFGLFLFSSFLYVRTLAPDILYGDSGELQTLAYTLGYTHSTGYPIYLFLARLLGFLPIGNLAWRVNLLSALTAALAVSFVYLIAKRFTKNHFGPILGSLLLAVSYTFWSQAIIAEVYAPGAAFTTAILFFLLYWHEDSVNRSKYLFWAAILTVSGVGVHASVGLLGLAAVPFVLWVAFQSRKEMNVARKIIVTAVRGSLVGVALLILAFLVIDLNNPKSSFTNVMLAPSRSIWGLQSSDLDSPFERTWLTLTGQQWQDAMFPPTLDLVEEFGEYLGRFADVEFSWGWLWITGISLYVLVAKQRTKGIFIVITLIVMLYFILHYEPPDKYLFYLPTYILLLSTAGAGVGLFFEWLLRWLNLANWMSFLVQMLFTAGLFLWITNPGLSDRYQAVKTGVAGFVREDYVFPVNKLGEPRAVAILYLSKIPEDAVLIMDWRALYATYFIAHVEGQNPNLQIYEAMPHGNQGILAESLIETLELALTEGKDVFSNDLFPGVEHYFFAKRLSGAGLYQLTPK